MQERQIVIAGQLVNYYTNDVSTPAAHSAVFLHGWGANAKIWQRIIGAIADYHCYALDLPGFGKSELPARPYSVGDYAEVTREFIYKLRLKNIVIVGHSFGGRIAIKCSAEHLFTIQKLVLVDSAGFRDRSPFKSFKVVLAKIVGPLVSAPLRTKISKTMGAGDYAESGKLRKTFLNVINEDLTEDLKRIATPTLIIWGENDKETPISSGKKMHSYILNSQLSILTHTGHYSFLEKPEEFVEKLMLFLSS